MNLFRHLIAHTPDKPDMGLLGEVIAYPPATSLTIVEVRQAVTRTAIRMGVPFDTQLIETTDDVIADIILTACLGPERAKKDY